MSALENMGKEELLEVPHHECGLEGCFEQVANYFCLIKNFLLLHIALEGPVR